MADVGATAPEVFRLSMERLPRAARRARRFALVEVLGAATALVAVVEVLLGRSELATDLALALWGLTAVALPYLLWRAGLRVRRRWNAFELALGNETIRCAARGSGRVILRLDEVESISEGGGGLVVRGRAGEVIRIPVAVEGYLEVRRRLAKRFSLDARPDALAWCAALVGAGLLAAVTASLWGRRPCVGIGVLLCQAAAAVAVALELRVHPRLSRAGKLAAVAVAVTSAALPLVGLGAAILRGA
jgi:hypothetical protein